MGKKSLALYATDEFFKDFKKLSSLTISQLEGFKETFKKEDSFDFDDDLVEKYLNDFKVDIKTLSSISAVVKYVRKFILNNSLKPSEIADELKLVAEKAEIKISENKIKLLTSLFEASETTIEKYTDSPYLNSVIPNLEYSTALFDLRAIYGDDSTTIKSLKPISVIRLGTVDDKDNKENFRFQTDLEGLNKLIEFFEQYRDKLNQLEELSKKIEK